MRVVLDTNVLISGLMLPTSLPGRIVEAWRSGAFELVLSEPMVEEIGRVLAYPKIRKRIGWSDEADTPVLAALIAGVAELLVSGDSDLLELRESYSIVSPSEFAARL